jgi:hypothetical protein
MSVTQSTVDAAYTAAQELAYHSFLLLQAAREPDRPAILADGRTVPSGSQHLAFLAKNVNCEASRVTHAQRILDVAGAILKANLSNGDYRIGTVVETTAHKAVLAFAQLIVNAAYSCHLRQMLDSGVEPAANDPDWPTTWAAAVWPTMRNVFAKEPLLNWNAVRVALEREHAATVATDQHRPKDGEGAGANGASDEHGKGQGTQWLTVTQAAKASGCQTHQITRAANNSLLKSNGKKGKERRIDAADLTLWLLHRAQQQEKTESDIAVEKKLKRATGE